MKKLFIAAALVATTTAFAGESTKATEKKPAAAETKQADAKSTDDKSADAKPADAKQGDKKTETAAETK